MRMSCIRLREGRAHEVRSGASIDAILPSLSDTVGKHTSDEATPATETTLFDLGDPPRSTATLRNCDVLVVVKSERRPRRGIIVHRTPRNTSHDILVVVKHDRITADCGIRGAHNSGLLAVCRCWSVLELGICWVGIPIIVRYTCQPRLSRHGHRQRGSSERAGNACSRSSGRRFRWRALKFCVRWTSIPVGAIHVHVSVNSTTEPH